MLKKDKINILLIVFLCLIIAGLCLKFLPSFPVVSDSQVYDTLALNLVQGEGFTLNNEQSGEAPVYPFFLAGIYRLFGHNYQIVKFIQFLLLAGMGIIVYLITRKILNLSHALSFLSSLTLIFWPYFIFYPTLIVTETLFIFLLLLSVYLFLRFQKGPSLKNALVLGGMLGISALVRPMALFLPFWIAFFLLRTHFSKLLIVLMLFITILAPWAMRNYVYTHQFTPAYSHVLGKSYVNEAGEANFKTVILARLKNIYLFWNPGATGSYTRELQKAFPILGILLNIYRVLFLITLALAFWSLRFIRRNKQIFLLWIVIFYFWAFHTLLWPYPRYTLPIIPLVIILAWFSIQKIWYKIGEKARSNSPTNTFASPENPSLN